MPQTEFLIPLTFIVIVGTVIIYGLTARPISRWLKVAESNPQGVLIIGAHEWAQDIALVIKAAGFRAAVIDTNWSYVSKARMAKIDAVYGNALSEQILGEINLNGIGKLLALTLNDEVNSLATMHYNEVLDKEELYQLHPQKSLKYDSKKTSARYLHGRFLFGEEYDFDTLSKKYYSGAVIKSTKLTEKFNFPAFKKYYGNDLIPMFIITEDKKLKVITTEEYEDPKPGQHIIALLNEPDENSTNKSGSEMQGNP